MAENSDSGLQERHTLPSSYSVQGLMRVLTLNMPTSSRNIQILTSQNCMSEPSKVRRQRKYSEISALEYPKNSQVSSSEGGERVPNEGIEESLGLVGWAFQDEGVGGLLKVRVEDFRVEEVSRVPALDPKGRFTVARVTLTNWETVSYTHLTLPTNA